MLSRLRHYLAFVIHGDNSFCMHAGQTEAQIGLEYDIIRRQVRSKYLNTNTNTNTNTNANTSTNTKIKETHQNMLI